MYYMSIYKSNIGDIYLKAKDDVLIGISFNSYNLELKETSLTNKVKQYLDDYFAKKNPLINFKYDLIDVTPFQKIVLNTLKENVKYGEVITYKELALLVSSKRKDNKKLSFQAVGQALNKNPLVILIPCHRVIGSDKSLKGYAYGIDRKKYLLDLESSSN